MIYKHLPLPLRHAFVTAYGAYWHWLRFGSGFEGFVNGYIQRERFTSDQWNDWQRERVSFSSMLGGLCRSIERHGTMNKNAQQSEAASKLCLS